MTYDDLYKAENDKLTENFFLRFNKINPYAAAVLTAHLALEEVFDEIISCVVKDTSKLQDARLQFNQKLKLAQSIIGDDDLVWVMASLTNDIRNKMAHLDKSNTVENLVRQLIAHMISCTPENRRNMIPKEDNKQLRLELALVTTHAILNGKYIWFKNIDKTDHEMHQGAS